MGALEGLQRDARGQLRSAPDRTGKGSAVVQQQTLKNPIHCSGIGLHSGEKIAMTLHPAPVDAGITMRRRDLPGTPELPATWQHAVETPLCTTLRGPTFTVATIEHVMSALAGCGIDNAVIELDGPEVPIMDGSAAPFVFLIECAGTLEQAAARRAIKLLKPVVVQDGARWARLAPGYGFWIDFEIDFDSAIVARQDWSARVTRRKFKAELARARTFGFLHEVEMLREHGLARGGSLNNAVVISEDGVLNEGGLRYEDEFVRHKVLDSIGDLYLAGAPIRGQFTGVRTGHAINLRLLRALFADSTAWTWTTLTAAEAGLADQQGGAAAPPTRAVAARA